MQSLASVGKGCLDLLVGFRGKWFVIEVKDGEKIQSKQALTPEEIKWILDVKNRAQCYVVTSEEEALKLVGCAVWREQQIGGYQPYATTELPLPPPKKP